MGVMRAFAALAVAFSMNQTAGAQTPPDIAAVLERAAQYVSNYEERQLGNLLMSENGIAGRK